MRLGDLLIQANLVSAADVTKALERMVASGGRIGENLVAIGAIDQRVLDSFLRRIPTEPANIAATGIDELDLMGLLLKVMYAGRLETCRQFVEAIKLPYHIVAVLVQMAVDRMLLRTLGMRESNSPLDLAYAFTEEGKRWTIDALERLRYIGPAPVALDDFTTASTSRSSPTNWSHSTASAAASATSPLKTRSLSSAAPHSTQAAPCSSTGLPETARPPSPMPSAASSTTSSTCPMQSPSRARSSVTSTPASISRSAPAQTREEGEVSFIRTADFDARWVPCRRPFVVTGGELTLEMLDLRYDPTGHFYEAPLHVKALGGCFIIDDFGRQLVSPRHLLNRWIVPLESRVDYLNLHTGKSFVIPFEELVMFSTNLEPEDLMDPAFLRRLPYKIEIGAPTLDIYKQIFKKECVRQKIELTDETFDMIAHKVMNERGLELASFQPRFIVDQVVSTCKFMGQPLHFEPRFIEYALNNLKVHRTSPPAPTAAITGQ